MPYNWFGRVAVFATLFALLLLGLAAYARASGLSLALAEMNVWSPTWSLDAVFIARIGSAILGILVLLLAILAWRNQRDPAQLLFPPTLALLLVIVHEALWWVDHGWSLALFETIQWLLSVSVLLLLWWMALRQNDRVSQSVFMVRGASLRGMTRFGIVLAFVQLALGVWVSVHGAGDACMAWLGCHAEAAWPAMRFYEGFVLSAAPVNETTPPLSEAARVAIHMTHRIGALLIVVYLFVLALRARLGREPSLRAAGSWLFFYLLLATALGFAAVQFALPLWLVVAHSVVAVLLLMALLNLSHVTHERRAV